MPFFYDPPQLRLRVGRRFLGYLVAFVATWLFPMINRLLQLSRGHSYPWLMALHALSKPSMGFFDSLVYGSVWAAVAHRRQFAADKAAHLANERRKGPLFTSVWLSCVAFY